MNHSFQSCFVSHFLKDVACNSSFLLDPNFLSNGFHSVVQMYHTEKYIKEQEAGFFDVLNPSAANHQEFGNRSEL